MQKLTPFTKRQIEKCEKFVKDTSKPMSYMFAQLTLRIDEVKKAIIELQKECNIK